MRVKTLTVLIVLISGLAVAPALIPSLPSGFELATSATAASGDMVYVGGTGPDNHSSIQEGIDAADENGTVYVYNGTYYENVVVNKTVDLIGEDSNGTIIDGGGSGDVVYVSADRVNISRFIIRHSGDVHIDAGICLDSVQDCNIRKTSILNSDRGISLTHSSGNNISGNNCSSNGQGIYVDHSCSNNTLSRNICSFNSRYGIYLHHSKNNIIFNNYFNNTNNAYDGGNNTWNISKTDMVNGEDYNIVGGDWFGGNYWSDFDEPSEGAYDNNSDGIIDAPYNISGGDNQDPYPLAEQWHGDTTPPETTLSLIPAAPNGNNGWYVTNVKATLTATDGGSGVAAIKYKNGEDDEWEDYSHEDDLFDDEGVQTLSYYSIDNAGNREAVTTKTIRVDTKTPETERKITSIDGEFNESRWYDENVTVELNADDGGGSPVTTYYRFVGHTREFQTYTDDLHITKEGVHRLEYFSRDRAGNAEELHNLAVRIDKSAPRAEVKTPRASYLYVMGQELIPLDKMRHAAVIIGPVPVEISAEDDVSGITKVVFSVDNTVMHVDNTTPYTWNWDETMVGPYNIEVDVENGAGDIVDRDIPVIVVNWKT